MDISGNIEKIREEFPVLSKLTYMNSAAHGPTLKRVKDATDEWWTHRANEEDVDAPDALGEAAKMLSCKPEELCLVNRVSQGLNSSRPNGRLPNAHQRTPSGICSPR